MEITEHDIEELKRMLDSETCRYISIGGKIGLEKLEIVDRSLKKRDIKVIIKVDSRVESDKKGLCNLDIMKFLRNARNIAVMSHSSVRLESIRELSELKNIDRLRISGFYNKNMDLKPIEKFENIRDIEIEASPNNCP